MSAQGVLFFISIGKIFLDDVLKPARTNNLLAFPFLEFCVEFSSDHRTPVQKHHRQSLRIYNKGACLLR